MTETIPAHLRGSPVRDDGSEHSVGSSDLSASTLSLVIVGGAVWTTLIGAAAVWRHNEFLSHRFDLGNIVQAVWSTVQGRPLEVTDGATGEQVVRLASHVEPILVLLAPFWLIYPHPTTLLIAQAAALASGLYPVVRLASKHVGDPVAVALLGVWYLVFPWVVWNAFNDVHPITFAIPFLLYAIWFLDERRLGLAATFCGLALLTGELVGLTVGALGVWYAIQFRRYRAGCALAITGFGWTAICLTIIIPSFNEGGSSRFYGRFESVGGSPVGLVKTVLTDPAAIYEAMTTSADLKYIALLLVPTALLALGQPLLMLVAAPQLSVNLLSDFWSTTQPMFQYVAPIVAPLVAATVLAVGRMPKRLRPMAAALSIAAAVAVSVAIPPLPGGQEFVFGERDSSSRVAAMRAAIELVPDDAPLMATNRLGAHLSTRETIHLFPMRTGADWAILDLHDPWLQVSGEQVDVSRFNRLVEQFDEDLDWAVIFDREDVRVYQRRT